MSILKIKLGFTVPCGLFEINVKKKTNTFLIWVIANYCDIFIIQLLFSSKRKYVVVGYGKECLKSSWKIASVFQVLNFLKIFER